MTAALSTAEVEAYAAMGWHIVPLHSIRDGACTCGKLDCSSPGKHPRTPSGLKDATTDIDTIRNWQQKWPDCNWAAATGAASEFVAVDIDPRHGGDTTLDALEAEHGRLPATITASTGGGGFHYLFQHPGAEIRNRSNLFPGVDVRGDGGYIVVAPSNHLNGRSYRWDEGLGPDKIALAPLPAWLLESFRKKSRRIKQPNGPPVAGRALLLKRAQQYVAKAEFASDGHRNDTAFNLAGHLAAFVDESGARLGESDIVDLLRLWNLGNAPPLPESELVQCAASSVSNGKPRGDKLVTLRHEQNGVSHRHTARQPVLVTMANVESRPTQWLWPNRIAKGRISLLVGMPGVGKSFLTTDLASRISTGTPWPDGTPCPIGSTILISAEDDPHDVIRPRLDALRADVRRIHLLSSVKRIEADGTDCELLFSLSDLDALEMALRQVPECQLIVVDPIGSFLGGRIDAHRDNEVRSVLAPVAKLAERYGPAMLIVAHRRKGGGGTADDLALGSRAFTGLARSVWHLTTDCDDKLRRLFLPGKNNLAAQQQGLAFTISGEPGAVHWERDPVAMNADEALARENGQKGHISALDEAAAWLGDALADGSRPGNELKNAAKADGISMRTLERARDKLGVIAGPEGFRGPWVWRLPNASRGRQESPHFAREIPLANCGESVELCQ